MDTTVTSIRLIGRPPWPPTHIYIGMPGPAARSAGIADTSVLDFGKPWHCLRDPRGWQTAYREYLYRRLGSDLPFRAAVRALDGMTLVCWCKGKRPEHNGNDHCHGDILAKAIAWLITEPD